MGMNWWASGGDVVLDRVLDGGSKVRTPLTCRWVMESTSQWLVTSTQELEVVQKVGPENGVLNICIEEDPLQGAPEPKVEVVGLGTKGCDPGVVDCLQRVTYKGRGTR